MKKILIFACLMYSAISLAQSVNDYQYVVVPSTFSFLKSADRYGLNTLTKGLLEKYGFVAYLDSDDIPDEIRNANCNKLYADVLENNNITNTKLTVVLKDCKNKIIFKSAEGKSREKEWRVAYNLALRDAFASFDALNYQYSGTPIAPAQPASPGPAAVTVATGESLFAQPIANGFQLVDTAPKVVMKIYNTANKFVFIAEKGNRTGVMLSIDGGWVFEYYADGKRQSETLNIKF